MRASFVLRDRAIRVLLAVLLLGGMTGCSLFSGVAEMLPDQTLAYKKSRLAEENLELPPDLKGANFDDAMDVPPVAGGATYSQYADGRAQRQQAAQAGGGASPGVGGAAAGAVLPPVENVELRRSGESRWLEVQAAPPQVWPRVVAFWREQGVLLVDQNPAVGVMKTDWIENRAEVPQDFVTRMIRKVADGLYATSTRDQYSIRMEPGAKGGTTEVHLTHRGMEEKLETGTLGDAKRTVWQPGKSDPGKEAEMLRRLMLFLGAPEKKASAALAGAGPVGGAAMAAAASTGAGAARLVKEAGGPVLVVRDEFQRGWRITGSALDRAGFAVKDRDMSRGVYYVRYDDADAGSAAKKRSWGERLAFWRTSDIDRVKEYQVKVEAAGQETRVSVLDPSGKRDGSASAERILILVLAEMK